MLKMLMFLVILIQMKEFGIGMVTDYITKNNSSSGLYSAPGQAFFISAPSGGSDLDFRTGGLLHKLQLGDGTG